MIRISVRKAMAVAAIVVMTTGAVGCGAKKAEQTSASTEVTSQEETMPYSNAEEASRYLEEQRSIHMAQVEKDKAYNESLAAKFKEREEAAAASAQAASEAEEASKQAEIDKKNAIIEEQSIEPGKSSEHETTTDVVKDPVTDETVTVPDGAVAVLPTEEATEPTQPAYPEGTLIETTEQTKADGLWPHNNWTNNLSGYTVPERYYLMLDAANEWCNDGKGSGMTNDALQAKMVAIGTSSKANMSGVHTYQFSGQTMSAWDFQMDVMDEDAAEGGYAFSYFRSFYDPSTDTTTIWYAYANPFK